VVAVVGKEVMVVYCVVAAVVWMGMITAKVRDGGISTVAVRGLVKGEEEGKVGRVRDVEWTEEGEEERDVENQEKKVKR
jgi:hypothetical protein